MLNATWVIAAALAVQSPAPPAPETHPTWTDDRPLTHIAQNFKQDVVALPRTDTAAVLAAGVIGALVTHPADDNMSGWAARSGESSYSQLGGALGDGWLHGSAAIGTYAIGKLSHNAKATHIGSDLFRTQLLNGVMTRGIKLVASRTRPTGSSNSFPSGHTSAAFASAAVLADHFGWKVAVPAYSVAGFVGFSRIRDNQHWLSDVVFGSALGVIAGKTVVATHRRAAFTVMPVVTKNGGGILLVRNSRSR